MPISSTRLKTRLEEISGIGRDKNRGINRLAYSSADIQARNLLALWVRNLQLEVQIDPLGNMFAKRPGKSQRPVIMLGSHLDSVTNGGPFDGTIGVIAALEVLEALNEDGLSTDSPVELVVFACEESSRFGCALLGSKYFTGLLKPEQIGGFIDKDGISVREELNQKGFIKGNTIPETRFVPQDVKAFLELHIEQFDLLKEGGLPIGIVEKIAAPTRLKIYVEGQASHSGATPMSMRKDALAASADIIRSIERLGLLENQYNTVATVTTLEVAPGNMNVVPGTVLMGVDIRGTNTQSKNRVLCGIRETTKEIDENRKGIKTSILLISDETPVSLDESVFSVSIETCKDLGIPFKKMDSPAGHDCMAMAKFVPSGLIFVRNVSGVSHNPAEFVTHEDCLVGVTVLYELVKRMANDKYKVLSGNTGVCRV